MMKAFVFLVVVLISVVSASRHGQPEYYWRDFNGTVPRDAFKVAQSGSDAPVYIGQGYFDNIGLLPGLIEAGQMKLSAVAEDRVYTITKNIKIMATDSKDQSKDFYWVPISYKHLESLARLTFLNLPRGGTENEKNIYIGRHSESDYTNIGKISTVEPYQGLIIPDAEGKVTVYKNFEILTMLNFDCGEIEFRSNENAHRALKQRSLAGLV